MKRISITLIFLVCFMDAQCQLADIARVEFTAIPNTKSNIGLVRKRILFNYPIKLKNDKYLLVGLDFSSINLTFKREIIEFDQEEIDNFKLLDLNIGYTFKINEDWRFGARISTGFSSNLRSFDLLYDDFVISSDIVFIRDKKKDPKVNKPNRLIVGASFSQNRGIPFPLPFISYYRKFKTKWSYNIGVPVINLQYHWSEKFRIKLFSQLDGFNSNLQRRILVNNNESAENYRLSLVLGGLRYEYKIGKHLESFLNTTYIFSNVSQLRNNNKSIIELDGQNQFHIRAGVRIKI